MQRLGLWCMHRLRDCSACLLVRTFRRWHGAWRGRVEATRRLATCITRKRVAFRQFKAWYWQCFDTNVQVRRLIRMLAIEGCEGHVNCCYTCCNE